jgi:methionyl-tRNA formyltransferase
MRIAFLGTSVFAVPVLEALSDSEHDIACIVTRPPKPAGRGKRLTQPPLAEFAYQNGFEVYQPEKLTEDFIETIRSLEVDVMVSAAYGAWLPAEFLESAPLGVVNVHPSILPAYRGASPITRAILDARTETGVSFMLTDSGWDTGPLLSVYREPILPDDTTGSLEERLSLTAAENIVAVIDGYSSGRLIPEEQLGESVYAKKISIDETWLDWNDSAEQLERKVRAFQPSPGARTMYFGKLLKIISSRVSGFDAEPGDISVEGGAIYVGCGGEGSLEILSLQPASKSVMNSDAYLRGSSMRTGDRLGKT